MSYEDKYVRPEPKMMEFIETSKGVTWSEFSVELKINADTRDEIIEKWVQFRKTWRQVYKELSADIRTLKSERKGHANGYVPGLFDAQCRARWMMLTRYYGLRQLRKAVREAEKEAA